MIGKTVLLGLDYTPLARRAALWTGSFAFFKLIIHADGWDQVKVANQNFSANSLFGSMPKVASSWLRPAGGFHPRE